MKIFIYLFKNEHQKNMFTVTCFFLSIKFRLKKSVIVLLKRDIDLKKKKILLVPYY